MGFKRFDPEDFVISANTVTSTVWSNNCCISKYFFYIFSTNRRIFWTLLFKYLPNCFYRNSAEVQFSIAYANSEGGGGTDFDASVGGVSPTTTIYGQYRTLVLEDENSFLLLVLPLLGLLTTIFM
jgi:hypothetical protein